MSLISILSYPINIIIPKHKRLHKDAIPIVARVVVHIAVRIDIEHVVGVTVIKITLIYLTY